MVKSKKKTIVNCATRLYLNYILSGLSLSVYNDEQITIAANSCQDIDRVLTAFYTYQNSIKIASPNGSGFHIVCSGHIIRCVSWTFANESYLKYWQQMNTDADKESFRQFCKKKIDNVIKLWPFCREHNGSVHVLFVRSSTYKHNLA